jgi:predicted RNA-binding protein
MNLIILKITKASHSNMRNAYKQNTHQNDSNFLTRDLWSKPKLGMQHIHLELLWNLTYAITKKNKLISRINISNKYKIVINSPEVHFGIKR